MTNATGTRPDHPHTRPCGCPGFGDPHLADCPILTGGPDGRSMDDWIDTLDRRSRIEDFDDDLDCP